MCEAERIAPGRRVKLHYRITLEDGTVADSSFDDEPLEFVVGDGTLQQGLEQVLLGLTAGQRRRFELAPWEAFGYADPEAVQVLPRSQFPPQMALAPGSVVAFTTPGGEEIAGIVKALDAESVTVDFSHPLAGHDLVFEVEILEVGDAQ